jgi:anaphase-promoting complex subunit 2
LVCVDTWDVAAIAEKLGGVAEPSVDKALEFWIDHGVLKALGDKKYQLLEIAEEGTKRSTRPIRQGEYETGLAGGTLPTTPALVVEEEQPAVSVVEQREAEQMRVFWQVLQQFRMSSFVRLDLFLVHSGYAHKFPEPSTRPYTNHAQICTRI